MSGFFNSKALRELAPGLAPFIANEQSIMRLLISPQLSDSDAEAIEKGYAEPIEVLKNWLMDVFSIRAIDESAISEHTLACLAYLISTKRIDIKIVLVDQGLFHPKVKIFSDGSVRLAVHGSANITRAGLLQNFEQVSISTSWGSVEQTETVNILANTFEDLWNNTNVFKALSYKFPDAIANDLIAAYDINKPPDFEDFINAWEKDSQSKIHEDLKIYKPKSIELSPDQDFKIPKHLVYEEGDFSHQGKAIIAWEESRYKGILQMATGSGKTITSLICAHRLYEKMERLLIVVAAPYLPLIYQWTQEAQNFGLLPVVPNTKSARKDKMALVTRSIRNLKLGIKDVLLLVVTNEMLTDSEFGTIISSYPEGKLLIADEVHNLGTKSFLGATPNYFDYRLGLSATPVRQYDEEGTEGLLSFFGPAVFEFSLAEAIGKCLVPYDYHIHSIYLTEEEAEEWLILTNKIKKMHWYGDGETSGEIDSILSSLLNRRRRVIEQAQGKIAALEEILGAEPRNEIRHTLVYTSDKYRGQLEQVNDLLKNNLKIKFHQLTAEETSTKMAKTILSQFASGKIQIITAMRVLDEGVDLPEVSTAFILASTTIMRQWVQRRGRVLRKCPAINKAKATVHDFVVLPPDTEDLKPVLTAELTRALEFAGLASNGYSDNGVFGTISNIMDKYHLR
ncbi:MAG: DEAD/DEAH box helicase family protein [Bacteroidetes bacterium]|nr:DEAD/DEAH box helicase family protein [Bacteroidota bacterium]